MVYKVNHFMFAHQSNNQSQIRRYLTLKDRAPNLFSGSLCVIIEKILFIVMAVRLLLSRFLFDTLVASIVLSNKKLGHIGCAL